ncbi:MAG TPA: hypothetical protein VL614_14865 [Acetobacteraceae bacterium]|jgi:hypothetical protein|nr:hypothetical protein [Acetobacteraceae bacterium]
MNGDEFAHSVRQLAQQQMADFRPILYGHIATYDPAGHRVKVIIPSLRDDDPAPTESGWMPLNSMSIGAGYGVQVAPFGGATIDNPTGGEQVLVGLMDHKRGVCACLGMTFNGVMQPPATVLEQPLQPGETVIFNKSGTFWRLHSNGDVETNAQGNVLVTAAQNVSITSAETVTVTGTSQIDILSGNVNLGAVGGKKIARDGDPVISGTIQASTTTVFSA